MREALRGLTTRGRSFLAAAAAAGISAGWMEWQGDPAAAPRLAGWGDWSTPPAPAAA